MDIHHLFSPLTVRGVTLPNRISSRRSDCWIFSSRGLYSHMGTVRWQISYQDLGSQPGKFQVVGPEIRLGDVDTSQP